MEHEVEFPYVHDLARLLTPLEGAGVGIPEEVREAEILTPYAVMNRYPTLFEPVAEEQYEKAVELAEVVVHWAHRQAGEGD